MAVGLMLTLLPVKWNLMMQNDCFGRVGRQLHIYRQYLFGYFHHLAFGLIELLAVALIGCGLIFFLECPVIKLMITGHWEGSSWRWNLLEDFNRVIILVMAMWQIEIVSEWDCYDNPVFKESEWILECNTWSVHNNGLATFKYQGWQKFLSSDFTDKWDDKWSISAPHIQVGIEDNPKYFCTAMIF